MLSQVPLGEGEGVSESLGEIGVQDPDPLTFSMLELGPMFWGVAGNVRKIHCDPLPPS